MLSCIVYYSEGVIEVDLVKKVLNYFVNSYNYWMHMTLVYTNYLGNFRKEIILTQITNICPCNIKREPKWFERKYRGVPYM